jgi:hypothetical protein
MYVTQVLSTCCENFDLDIFFCRSKISMKIDISPILKTRFFFFQNISTILWTQMTETVPKIQFISDFISDIISSLKLYFRRDTDGGKIVTYFVTCEFL